MRRGVVRLEAQRLGVAGQRGLESALLHARRSQVAVRLRTPGLEANRLLKAVHPALDRRGGQRDVRSYVLERAAGVLSEQRNDSTVNVVH